MNKKQAKTVFKISFPVLTFIAGMLLVLKIMGYDVSWWLIFGVWWAPLWILLGIFAAIISVVCVVGIIVGIVYCIINLYTYATKYL